MSQKKRVNLSIDADVYATAKRMGLNVSGVAETALRNYIHRLDDVGDHADFSLPADPPDDSKSHREYTDATVEHVVAEYEDYAINVLNRSQATLNQHSRYIGRLLRRTETPPGQIKQADIIDYLKSEQPMSEAKKKNILSALRVFFREFIGTDIAEDFEMPARQPHPTTVPTKDGLQTFYEAIENPKYRAIFLMYATSGLRSAELLELTVDDIDEEMRMLIPDKRSEVKQTWASFYNEEAERAYEAFKPHRDPNDDRIFQAGKPTVNTIFRRLSEQSGVKITPQKLRRWFASEMASLGVDSSYIDAFCGRTPSSVLEEHYLDYSPRKLKQIYDGAGLTVLE